MQTLSLFSLLAACNAGDRATHGCPSDEVCSEQTPSGLSFESYGYANRLVDTGPEVTAVGGKQTVTLLDNVYTPDAPLGIAYGLTSGEFVEATVASAAKITLTGKAVGSNYLRVVDPGSGELFDRISIGAGRITKVRAVPFRENYTPTERYAFAPGGKLVIELNDDRDRSLVDEGLVATGALAPTPQWDVFTVPPAAGVHTATIKAGDAAALNAEFEVAGPVTRVAHVSGATETTADKGVTLCFAAYSEAVHVVGLTWQFAVAGGQASASNLILPACVDVTPSGVGEVQVTANAGGQAATVMVRVTAAPSKLRSRSFTEPTTAEAIDATPAAPLNAGERGRASL